MTKPTPLRPPSHLSRSGRAMWRQVTGAYELESHELVLLTQACATVDTIDQLQAVIDEEGVTSVGSTGQRVTHPAVGEIRLQRVSLARLLGALALPDVDGGQTVKTGHQARSATAHKQRWANVRALRGGDGA